LVNARKGLLTLVALAGAAPAFAQPAPSYPPEITKYLRLQSRVNAAGIRNVTLMVDGQMRTFRERVLKQGLNMRIEFADGPNAGSFTVESGGRRFLVNPARREARTMAPMCASFAPASLMSRLQGREGRWAKSTGGDIAGAKTVRWDVFDSRNRIMQRFWVEPNRGLILKRQIFDENGRVVGGFEFEVVKFDVEMARQVRCRNGLECVFGAHRFSHHPAAGRTQRRLPARIVDSGLILDPGLGYNLDAVRILSAQRGSGIVMSVYADETTQLSLYIMKQPLNTERLRRLTGQRLKFYSWQQGGQYLTLIGALPQEELARLARSARTQQR